MLEAEAVCLSDEKLVAENSSVYWKLTFNQKEVVRVMSVAHKDLLTLL